MLKEFYYQGSPDDVLGFGEENRKRRFKNPYITLCHVVFRSLALVVYLFCGWFASSFISSFVCVTVLLALDFWIVKNVTGRFMVGLRWWNHIDEQGKSRWIYESRKESDVNQVDPNESKIFWTALVATPVVWVVFFIVALFSLKFKWMLLVCIALSMSFANLVGYVRCRYGKGEGGVTSSMSSMANNFFQKQLFKNAMDLVGGSGSATAGAATVPRPTSVV